MAEIEYAISLGITVTTNFAPKAFKGKAAGNVQKLEYVEFAGRDGDSSAKVYCDYAVLAIGQAPEDMSRLTSAGLTEKGGIAAKKNGAASVKGVFAAGDIVNGGKTVVEAVAAGKLAAQSILGYLSKKKEVK
jgi:dihydropyrimidine dehydrogenase (NAD+) subunit PreT